MVAILPMRVTRAAGPVALFLFAVVFKWLYVMPQTYGPVVFKDELLYREFAERLWSLSFYGSTQYPPLYPALLAPAFAFGDGFYEAMLVINVIVSSAAVFPAYAIARLHLGRVASLLCASVVAVLPFHIVFPRALLSENLYFPLLLVTFYAVLVDVSPRRRLTLDIATGALLGALYLTRHISLVLIPVMLIVWWLKPFEGEHAFGVSKRKLLHLLALSGTMVSVYLPWVLLNLRAGNGVMETLGFGIASRTNPEQLTPERMGLVAVGYLAYYVLLAPPVVGLVLAAPLEALRQGLRSAYGRLVTAIYLSAGAVFVAVVRHSWRAHYNFPEFSKIMGRYPLHFAGLFVLLAFVTSCVVMARYATPADRLRRLVAPTVAGAVAVLMSWMVLVDRTIVPMTARMSDRGAVDGYRLLLVGAPIMWLSVVLVALYGVLVYLGWKRTTHGMLAATLVVFFLLGTGSYLERLRARQGDARLARGTAELISSAYPDGATVVLSEPSETSISERVKLARGLRFWGVRATVSEQRPELLVGDGEPIVAIGPPVDIETPATGESGWFDEAGRIRFVEMESSE